MEAVIAVITLGLIHGTGGNPQPLGVFDCETIDRGGYHVFADPTCPAQYRERDDYDAEPEPVEEAPAEPEAPEAQ